MVLCISPHPEIHPSRPIPSNPSTYSTTVLHPSLTCYVDLNCPHSVKWLSSMRVFCCTHKMFIHLQNWHFTSLFSASFYVWGSRWELLQNEIELTIWRWDSVDLNLEDLVHCLMEDVHCTLLENIVICTLLDVNCTLLEEKDTIFLRRLDLHLFQPFKCLLGLFGFQTSPKLHFKSLWSQ